MTRTNWIHSGVATAMNGALCMQSNGLIGVRDDGLLESALARPQNMAVYGEPTVFDIASAYAFGIIQNHPFLDGNKRTGFLVAYTFLGDNGWELDASETEAYMAVMALAQKEIDEKTFAAWLRKSSKRIKKTKK